MIHQVASAPKEWGLLACGSSGQWQIDVDETRDGNEWELQLDSPHIYLRFTLPDLQVVAKLLAYLQAPTPSETNGITDRKSVV